VFMVPAAALVWLARGVEFPSFYRRLKLAKAVRRPVFGMARGTVTPGVAGRQGTARPANGERRPALGGSARPVGLRRVVMGYWRADVGARLGNLRS
jgi:hypothetical protein